MRHADGLAGALRLRLQVPTTAQVASVTEDLRSRSAMPAHIKTVLESLPDDTHPMTQFSVGVMALQVRGWQAHAHAQPKGWHPRAGRSALVGTSQAYRAAATRCK